MMGIEKVVATVDKKGILKVDLKAHYSVVLLVLC